MSTAYNGFCENLLTFKAASGFTSADVPVKISANDTVAACANNNAFCGISRSVREGYAAVQLTGAATLSYSGTAPSVGYAMLAADGSGKVKTVESGGRSLLVIAVDTTNSLVTILL